MAKVLSWKKLAALTLVLLVLLLLFRRPPRIQSLRFVSWIPVSHPSFGPRKCTNVTIDAALAEVTGCDSERGMYYRAIQYEIPHAAVLVDIIGAKEGFTGAMMLQLWRPLLGVRAPVYYKLLQGLGYQGMISCGPCDECKDSFEPVLPMQFRSCTRDRHCLTSGIPSLRLYSFDENAMRVAMMNEAIKQYPPPPVHSHVPLSWQRQRLNETWTIELVSFATGEEEEAWTVDAWSEREKIGHIDFLKAEGHDILKGAMRTLSQQKITVLFDSSSSHKDTMEEMEVYGYACYFSSNHGMVKLTHGCWNEAYSKRQGTICVLTTNPEGRRITRAFDDLSF